MKNSLIHCFIVSLFRKYSAMSDPALQKSLTIQQWNNRKAAGFTFIELLAVMAVLGVIGVIIGTILYTSLRGNSKTNAITTVRQNGNGALSIMAKMIRGAKSFDGVSVDDSSYSISCLQLTPGAGTPTPTPVKNKYLKITSFDNKQTTFACCATTSPPTIASGSGTTAICGGSNPSLLDTSAVSFDASMCSFTCSQVSSANVPTITIHFELNTSFTVTPTVLPEKTAGTSPIQFDTSVTFRNLVR